MTGNRTMDYYVQPWHLYSHSRTCTHSGLCRIHSRLVASLICYIFDRASVHEILALVTWFQCMSSISSHDPLYIFIMKILIYVYCTWRWPHMLYCIMPIHGHCTLMYSRLLYVFIVICCIFLIGWLVLPLGSSSLHLLDGLIMYFGHRMNPMTSHIRGHLL